ncbi:cell division protein ZipA [Microbulbifer rhizosphaerae]|uniref:Cell division protein ZipA n=1 Tax=Microbulbifer rhizosphaerae TaxID=1562603 RepID=A0A7W4WAQ3_9GAMM|nr:cell division protein ZipA [Microbulbifer rhizosphaerae]MBB3060812.1 cell division protein ZipA [Microbulbifer rhizosphaerae]
MGNWLITILALVLLLAILDGVRRAIKKQRAAMKVSRNLSRAMQRDTYGDGDEEVPPPRSAGKDASAEEEEEYLDPEEEARRRQIAAELPGQVRVVQRRALEEALQVNRLVQETFQSSRKPLAGSGPHREEPGRDEPEQASLNLEEQVPTLMESVGDDARREPALDESASLEALNDMPAAEEMPPPGEAPLPTKRSRKTEKAPDKPKKRRQEKSPVEEVLIINIMAQEGDLFEGNDLLRVLLAAGMRFGDMNIFHYHAGGGADGPVIFSLANMVVPGTFDLTQMEEFISPGVSLFLALPIEGEAIKAFEILLSTSRQIAEQLGGELKDENRSVFTAQTAEHYRQRVMEYQRRKALARAQA